MGSGNEYEAGHLMCYHVNHTGSDNKDPDDNWQFCLCIYNLIWVIVVHMSHFFCLFCC